VGGQIGGTGPTSERKPGVVKLGGNRARKKLREKEIDGGGSEDPGQCGDWPENSPQNTIAHYEEQGVSRGENGGRTYIGRMDVHIHK